MNIGSKILDSEGRIYLVHQQGEAIYASYVGDRNYIPLERDFNTDIAFGEEFSKTSGMPVIFSHLGKITTCYGKQSKTGSIKQTKINLRKVQSYNRVNIVNRQSFKVKG